MTDKNSGENTQNTKKSIEITKITGILEHSQLKAIGKMPIDINKMMQVPVQQPTNQDNQGNQGNQNSQNNQNTDK